MDSRETNSAQARSEGAGIAVVSDCSEPVEGQTATNGDPESASSLEDIEKDDRRFTDSTGILCSEEEEIQLFESFREVLSGVVQEKREYDFLVNRLSKSASDVVASKKKHQISLLEISESAQNVLNEILSIEKGSYKPTFNDPKQSNSNTKSRGPPLPSQCEMFEKAYQAGQLQSNYSRFSQRQNYYQSSRNREYRY